MAQIRNKYNIPESNINSNYKKQLPNFFDAPDEIKHIESITISILAHVFFALLLLIISLLHGLIFPFLPKPELPTKNIEFKLVQNESKPPINKNTKIRSDRDSQAGGKHDPKKAVSEPSRAASKQVKKVPEQKPQPKKELPKQLQKPAQKPMPKQEPQKVVSKPAPAKPTAIKPTVKPTVPQNVTAPSAPKVVSAPKSPFAIEAPSVKAPVGNTYKPSGQTSAKTGSTANTGNYAPVPKFSSSGGSSTSSSSKGQYASKGSYGGYGSGGNPSPGNPNGAPGIDALRQPNWGPYMNDLEQRIKRNWTPPKGDTSKRVVITFTIGRDGRLLSTKVVKSSGVPLADRAALSAIELTAPFRPLPPEFRGQSVPIEFTFDYNVINSILR